MPRQTTLEHPVKTKREKWEFEAGESPAMATRVMLKLYELLEDNEVQWLPEELLSVSSTIALSMEGNLVEVAKHISELDWHWDHSDVDKEALYITLTFTEP